MNTTRLYRFIVLMVVGIMCIGSMWSGSTQQSVAQAKPSVRKLSADSTDIMAHAAGSEWHDKNQLPLVVDFDSRAPQTPDGMNQWLQGQGVKLAPMPKAGITSRKKMLVLRMAFADRTAQRYSNAQIQTNWFDRIQTLFQKMSNGNFPGWDVTIKDSVTLTTFGGLSAINRNNYDSTNWSTAGASLDKMFARYIALAPDKAALFAEINQADTITILLNNGALTGAIGAYSWSRSFVFPAPVNKTINKGIILMDEDQYHRVDGDNVIWGALAHEMAHAMQQYASFDEGSNHPSNYNSNFELLDVNMPGQSTDYMKTTGFKDWLPAPQTITISSSGKTQSDLYCLNAIEIDYHNDPTPQILRVNITEGLYYLVTVRKRMNGDDLQTWYRWQNAPQPNSLSAGIPDEGVLINRVITGGTQWHDLDGDGVQDDGEVQDWRVIVRGPPNVYPAAGTNQTTPQNIDKLWQVGQIFNNFTDGTPTRDMTDGISIGVASKTADGSQYCVRVNFGSGAMQPDVALRPWRQAPGNGYETTDIWIDSPLNGYGTFRYGFWNDLSGNQVPRGNGDDPAIGSVNRIYARVRNVGSAPVVNPRVDFSQSNPLGVGVPNDAAWTPVGSVWQAQFPGLATIPVGGFVDVYIEWTPNVTLTQDQVNAGVFSFHSCIKVNVSIPSPPGVESILGNNEAQENIQNFEATPTRSPLFDYSFKLYNTNSVDQLYHLTRINNLPSGWNLSINNDLESVTIPAGSVAFPKAATIPVTVTATGSSIIGSSFTVNVGVSQDRILKHRRTVGSTVVEVDHQAQMNIGGFDFTVNVLADTSITCEGYIQDGRVSVVGTLDGFQGIHQAGTPLRAYAQLYDTSGNQIPLDDRAAGDVGSNGVFRMNFSYYRPNKGQVTQIPKSVRCLFPGTHLLASSGSQNINLNNQAPPTATIVPWFASQFHSNLALNGMLAPFFPYGNFTCAFGRCPVLVAGERGRGARMIDANSTMLQSTANILLGANFSVSLWARRTRNNMEETLVSHGNSFLTGRLFNMGFADDNRFVCSNFNDDLRSSTVIQDRDWHHYVCVVNGNQRRLYIDGIQDASQTSGVANYNQNATMYVGRRMDSLRAFDGTIDELRVFTTAVNDVQIGQLYAVDPTMATVPVASMTFDDVIIAESNSVFSYCANLSCPKVYYPDVYYPDTSGNPTPTTNPATTHNRPYERFAAAYMEPNRPMSYGVWPGTTVTPYPGNDGSLMFWARLDDTSTRTYPLVQSVTNPVVNRPSVAWTGSTHELQFANLNYTWNDYDNKWHLFTFVKRGTQLELYIDNNLVTMGAAPSGLQPFRVASGSTLNVGGVSGGEIAAVEVSPFAYPYTYIRWRYETGIPNPAPAVVNPSWTALAQTSQAMVAALTATGVAQQATNQAIVAKTATSLNRTQMALNATETSRAGTETAVSTRGWTLTPTTPIKIILPTWIIIGFPTLQPTYTKTHTATMTATRNPNFTVTSTRTNTATQTSSATRTQTRTVTRTMSRTSTRTRISTPTFVTMTATRTMSPTAISTTYGPDTTYITRLPAGMLARALQFIQDQRENPCTTQDIACPASDWNDPAINDVAIPFYRPDISAGMVPAYYEIALTDRKSKQPRGFIMMAVDYSKTDPQCVTSQSPTCGIVDYPIAHWNSTGPAMSSQLLSIQFNPPPGIIAPRKSDRISTDGLSEYKLWKLDTLSYVAIQNDSLVASVGSFPVLINNLSYNFDTYANTRGDGDTTWTSVDPQASDDPKSEGTQLDIVHSGIDDAAADKTWQFSDIDIKNNFTQYVSKYSNSFYPLLNQLKQDATPQWLNERLMLDPLLAGDQSNTATPRYNIPVQANSVNTIVLPFRGVTLNNITNESPDEKRISFTLDTSTLAGFAILKVTTGAMPTNDLPRLRISVQMPYDVSSQGPYQNTAKFTFFMTDKVTQVCPSGDYCPLTTSMLAPRSWAPWRTYWAGSAADQRNYNQFDAGGGCLSGCGPTAWMMLFGWVDYKSSPAPSYAASSVWPKRWNAYRAGGTTTGANIGSSGTAPQSMDTGVRNAILSIRSSVDTFCFPLSSSGATVPWKMDNAASYLGSVGTSMGLDTHYNIVGAHEDRLTRYALESLTSANPRPVVIGTGHLSHYPLAWGIRYTTRPENWDEGWFDGDDVVWYQYWYVNQGWGGNGNGWIQTGTWFAGRVFP